MSASKPINLRSLEILQNIKSGSTDPASLSSAQRKLIVMLLMAEGQSTAEIAHLLKVSDRTIERDKQVIRKDNALIEDPEYAGVMAGRLVNEAQICIQRMRKIQRDPNCPPAAKIDAEKGCFQVLNNLAERLQSMGFLPTAAKKLEANLMHHADKALTLDEIHSETQRLQGIETSLPAKETEQLDGTPIRRKKKKRRILGENDASPSN
jgi:transposase